MAKTPAYPPGQEPTHFKKYALSQYLGISRPTLDTYLNREGAPLPNKDHEYEGEKVAAFIASCKTEAGGTKKLAHYKEEKFRLECERIAMDIQAKRGDFITKEELRAGAYPLMAELDQMMEQQFVLILPAKYKGRDTLECQEMNRAAKDLINARFRKGLKEMGAA